MKKFIPLFIKEFIIKITYRFIPMPYSFSQAGEDKILSYLFSSLGIKNPTYLDIGANHPVWGNNTYLFYQRGCKGVCIDADPSLLKELKKERKNDKCLSVGITFDDRKEADFYIFPIPALNTLSKEEADYREKNGSYKVIKKIKIPLKNINEIIKEHFYKTPDLISLDVEGIDFEILKSLDFSKSRPIAICVETISYSENRTEHKLTEIIDFVKTKGYFVYADTHINTIFVNENVFNSNINNS